MAKRLMALLGVLAFLLTTTLPMAFAQETPQHGGGEVSATGVLVDELPADVAANGTHSISDEATGELYALRGAGANLDPYVGERVTVYGALTPAEGPAPGQEFGGSLPSIDVTRVEPAGGVEPGPRVVEATGVLGEPYTPSPDPTPVYDLTDEATNNTYTLFDVGAGLDAFVGERVTVEGTRSPGINPLALDVTSVTPAGEPVEGEEISVSFELLVAGEPPAGTTFFGLAGQQPVELENPDGDDVHEGTLVLPEDFGTFEIPVAIVEGDPAAPERTIEDFGEVVLEDGHLYSAYVSFDGTEPPAPPTAEEGSATGTIERLEAEPVVVDGIEICGASTHSVVDEETGRRVDLVSDAVGLDAYVGRTVAVFGKLLASPAVVGAERCPDLDVTRVEAADVDPVDPAPVVDPVDPAPVDPAPGADGGGNAVVSGDGNDAGKKGVSSGADADGNGSVNASDGEKAAEISAPAPEGGASSAASVLPATSGVLPVAAALGALLLAGWGLVARRFAR